MAPEYLYGIHPVREAIRAGRRRVFAIYVVPDKKADKKADKKPDKKRGQSDPLIELARSRNIPVKTISPADIRAISQGGNHQSVAAKVGPYPFVELSRVLGGPDPQDIHLLVLDSIADVQNLGALLRTAICAGIGGVIIPRDRAADPSPAACRASAGALEHMRLVRVTNLSQTLKSLKKQGIWVAGADGAGSQSLYQADLSGPLALVIGGEEKGIRPLVKKQCDFLLSIPQKGPLDSLNASAAGAVMMYEAFRQRWMKRG